MIANKLNAGNDRNGNPRRVFVVVGEHGGILEVIDEGYSGDAPLAKKYPMINLCIVEFSTTPKEYRWLLNNFSKKD